jgi:hypothetical protein
MDLLERISKLEAENKKQQAENKKQQDQNALLQQKIETLNSTVNGMTMVITSMTSNASALQSNFTNLKSDFTNFTTNVYPKHWHWLNGTSGNYLDEKTNLVHIEVGGGQASGYLTPAQLKIAKENLLDALKRTGNAQAGK